MATVVFGTLGTLVGGPLGGAVGSLIGRTLDQGVLGSTRREGPRLRELAVSSSSYGQPIARLFGATRAAGTIIWATDLRESRESTGGGKGQPKVTQYSYAVSLAVALSSRPIEGIGRIWADGNLLRGAADDLKTGGSLRVYRGHADQAPDPLMGAALGASCPAYRGLAYVVFEDLQLGDFGNRIPALSFEVFADGAGAALPGAVFAAASVTQTAALVPAAAPLAGYAHEGESLRAALENLAELAPMVVEDRDAGLALGPEVEGAGARLPVAIAWPDGEFGTRTGHRRLSGMNDEPNALRYYDAARDYQPGVQRAAGRAPPNGDRTVELPATIAADGARALVDAARWRAATAGDRLQARIASLDPGFMPGALVSTDEVDRWRVESWEWRDGGVELALVRTALAVESSGGADAGASWRPVDRLPAMTRIEAFEVPWDGTGAADAARVHCAVGASDGRWAGAALYAERAGALVPLGASGLRRATLATLTAPVPPSPALWFEPEAVLEIACDASDADFATVDGAALAAGANRLLLGDEIVQFMAADPLGAGRWRLSGLLRGRGGTEAEAQRGHPEGSRAVLLDDRLQLIDPGAIDPAVERIAAIGSADSQPVFASVVRPGRSRMPPSPVHPVAQRLADGALALAWTRRARGQWVWHDGVEVPLVEEAETYQLGAGPVAAPHQVWSSAVPALTIAAAELAGLPPGIAIWVRQLGSFAPSPALVLYTLP